MSVGQGGNHTSSGKIEMHPFHLSGMGVHVSDRDSFFKIPNPDSASLGRYHSFHPIGGQVKTDDGLFYDDFIQLSLLAPIPNSEGAVQGCRQKFITADREFDLGHPLSMFAECVDRFQFRQ